MTYVKRWTNKAQEDLRLMTEAVRIRVRKTAALVAAAPHAEQTRIDSDTNLRVRSVEGTLLDMYYRPDVSNKTVVIESVTPAADLYGNPYTDLA